MKQYLNGSNIDCCRRWRKKQSMKLWKKRTFLFWNRQAMYITVIGFAIQLHSFADCKRIDAKRKNSGNKKKIKKKTVNCINTCTLHTLMMCNNEQIVMMPNVRLNSILLFGILEKWWCLLCSHCISFISLNVIFRK